MTLQGLQKHCSQAVQEQTESLQETNAIAKPDPRLCSHGSQCDPQKAFLGTCTLRSKVPFCFGKKYHRSPALESRNLQTACYKTNRRMGLIAVPRSP